MNLAKPLLEELLNKQIRFKIPVFQRHYVWNEQDQLVPLWDDFINKFNERLNKQKIHPHYTGSIVLFHENTTTSTLSTYNVIDGQQRLTTFQLFITAFREVCRKHVEDESLIKELDKYLFNDKSFGDKNYQNQKFKLEPTKFNKEIFKSIVDNSYDRIEELHIKPVLREHGIGPKSYRNVAKSRHKILGAYIFFYDKLNEFIEASEVEITELIKTLLLVIKRDFQFVEIGLTQNDDPQMIFETMNGRGASLSETDLIRNYIFMRANSNEEDLDEIYAKYWDEFDDPTSKFGWHEKTSRGRYSESYLQFYVIDYLTLKMQTEIRYDQVFYYYKLFTLNTANFQNIEEELKELNRYSQIFKKLSEPKGDSYFERLAKRLKDMDISTLYPLLLYVEGDDGITRSDKDEIYTIFDSYLTRRFLCGLTTKNYNNIFLEYLKFLNEHKNAEAFKIHLQSKTSETNMWPSNNMLLERLLERPIYREEKKRTKSISNILLEIERFNRGRKQEQVNFLNTGLHIEHLLPQNWFKEWPLGGQMISEEDFELSPYAVRTEDDKDGKYHKIEERNKMLHTIGNLTILTSSLNPSISNSSFSIKKREIGSQSTLIINQYLQTKDTWDEEEIQERTKSLYQSISKIWLY